MKIEFAPYTLQNVQGNTHREGALLRFTFDNGSIGYADCHPWHELGDLPLTEQISQLSQNKFTSLTQRSLYFAQLDAHARSNKINLFNGLTIPSSHYLLPNLLKWNLTILSEILEQQFTHVKIKLGDDLPNEINRLKALFKWISVHPIKIRLDFNLKLSQEQFRNFLEEISPWKNHIDFCEDPFSFDLNSWKEMQNLGFKLACDAFSEKALNHFASAAVCILKPAVQSEKPFLNNTHQRLVVTSYLDHPFGQLCAAYIAAKNKNSEVCGLLSHRGYQKNAFSEQLSWNSPQFNSPSGTGFGFDDLLVKQLWKAI